MTITFFSNFLNHHQLPLCQEFIKLVGDGNFHFVSCERIHQERAKMGYEDMNVKYPFVVRAYESETQMQEAKRLAHDSDVAIIGSASQIFTDIRGKEDKLTFLFRERLFKNGTWHRFNPSTALSIYKDYLKYKNKKFYVLCASAFTADDVSLCGFPREKCLRWGYFPETMPKNNKKSDSILKVLWCGRMLWWKYPELAVEVARLLNLRGVDFEINIVGNGEKRELVEQLIYKYNLREKIFTSDFLVPADIRQLMIESNIYLFTSGKQEGWGVVLNEAMNSGCVTIANKNAGSSTYLINNEINGFLYDGSKLDLERAVDRLLNANLEHVSNEAFRTINELWNPQIAANRLLQFITNGSISFEKGPCSLA